MAQGAGDWSRAAELPSPAPRGHFLREFGQSDRDLIDNANSDASMPQALVLMNSELFEAILASEEEHIDWLETQLGLIAKLGETQYLAEQMHK